MKTQNLNISFLAGSFIMLIPAVFFFSVIMEQFFNNNYLIENIFVPIDKISGLISAFLMIGLPFIAVCINIIPLVSIEVKNEKEKFRLTIELKAKILNIIIICLGVLTIMTIMGYLFTENFRLK